MILIYIICLVLYIVACYCLIQGNYYENKRKWSGYDKAAYMAKQQSEFLYGVGMSILVGLVIFGVWAISMIE